MNFSEQYSPKNEQYSQLNIFVLSFIIQLLERRTAYVLRSRSKITFRYIFVSCKSADNSSMLVRL